MQSGPLFIVDIIGEVVAATDAKLFPTLGKHILYQYGRSIQILRKLVTLNEAIKGDTKGSKYPLFALFQPFPEDSNTAYYCTVRFPLISIATLTTDTDFAPARYTNNMKPILYPIWEEFKRQLCRHPNIVANDPGALSFIKEDYPGTEPISDKAKKVSMNDYIDAIEVTNLILTFKQVNKCKSS